MAEVYNFRRMIKDKLLKDILDLDGKIKRRGGGVDEKEQLDGFAALAMSFMHEPVESGHKGLEKGESLTIL